MLSRWWRRATSRFAMPAAPPDQLPLLAPDAPPAAAPALGSTSQPVHKTSAGVRPVAPSPELSELARALSPRVHLGTSSWHFPGWNGLVWDGDYAESRLSKRGLAAYAQHPLLRSVSLDRAFYRPLSASQYARYAAQVPPDFRFIVKAPALITDAWVRAEDGRGKAPNPAFLDHDLAWREFVEPALEGLARASARWCSRSAHCRRRTWRGCRN